MRILFLVPYPTDEAPSQRFRFEQYFPLLKKNNIDFSVSSFWNKSAWAILYQPGKFFEKLFWLCIGFIKRCIDMIRAIGFDLIFIHRECAPLGPPVFEFVLAKILRKKIIYDFDDAIWMANTSQENRLAAWAKFHGKVKPICRWSRVVSCGNAWLADYAKRFNVNTIINPTTIDTEYLHNPTLFNSKKEAGKIVIGWTGTHSTIGYLNTLLQVLQSIEKKYPIIIRIISNKDPQLPFQSAEFVPWNKETEIADLMTFDIGIMPLTDDEWAKGKCGFKALQYMALGIPCIASPVGVNSEIIKHGFNGLLCRTDLEWEADLEQLIGDQALRKRLGNEARKTVEKNYSVSSNATNFFSLTKS
jgi:glycosyltransferase involved in cell wall biosynthesis